MEFATNRRTPGRLDTQGVLFPEPPDGDAAARSLPAFATPKFTAVRETAQLDRALAILHPAPVLACDTETTGLDWRTASLRLVQLATPDHAYLVRPAPGPGPTAVSAFRR